MQGFAVLNTMQPHCCCWWHAAVKAHGQDGGLGQTSPHCPADWHTELFWSRCWHSPFTNVPSKWGEQIYQKQTNKTKKNPPKQNKTTTHTSKTVVSTLFQGSMLKIPHIGREKMREEGKGYIKAGTRGCCSSKKLSTAIRASETAI